MSRMDMQERATLGPLIRAAREGREWSQEELATRAGTTRRTIGSIERGDTTGQVKIIERVLKALGVVDGLVIEPDVKTFVRTITPLLQRLSEQERAQVMPAIVELVAVALERRARVEALPPHTPLRSTEPDDVVVFLNQADDEAEEDSEERPGAKLPTMAEKRAQPRRRYQGVNRAARKAPGKPKMGDE